jgi:hypothetical protein
MGFRRTAEIDDAPTQERDDVTCATGGFRLLTECDVAVIGGVRLRPSHQTLDLGGVEGLDDGAVEGCISIVTLSQSGR